MKITPIIFLAVFFPITAISLTKAWGAPLAVPATPEFTLTSPAFEYCSVIPNKFTQAEANYVSPKLEWTNVPPTTVSFVLLGINLDGVFEKTTEPAVHCLIFNVPGMTRELPEGVPVSPQLPDGSTQCKNRRGFPGYLGMGATAAGPYHHYTFQLYALDTKLQLEPDAIGADVAKAMNGHILGQGTLVVRFRRP